MKAQNQWPGFVVVIGLGLLTGGLPRIFIFLSFTSIASILFLAFALLSLHFKHQNVLNLVEFKQCFKKCILYVWLLLPISAFFCGFLQGMHLSYYRNLVLAFSSLGLVISAYVTFDTLGKSSDNAAPTQ